MTSLGDQSITTDSRGNALHRVWGKGADGIERWYTSDPVSDDMDMHGNPMIPKTRAGGVPTRSAYMKRMSQLNEKEAAVAKAKSDFEKGERFKIESDIRRQEAIDTPHIQKPGLHAINQIKGIGQGLKDIAGFASYGTGRLTGSDALESFGLELKAKNERDIAKRREAYKEFGEENWLSAIPGNAIPYLAAEAAFAKPAAALAGKIIGSVGSPLSRMAQGTGGAVGGAIKQTASGKGALNKPAKGLKDIVDEIEHKAKQKANTSKAPGDDHFYKDVPQEYLGSAGLGAAISGIHPDESMLEGALAGLAGTYTGRKVGPYTSQGPNKNTAAVNEDIHRLEADGFHFLPGAKSGRSDLKRLDALKYKNPKFMNVMDDFDAKNQQAILDKAGKAMGLEKDEMQSFTKGRMMEEGAKIKGEYKALEEGSYGVLSMGEMRSISDFAKEKMQSASRPEQNKIKSLFDRMARTNSKNGERGFSGKEYQDLRSTLRDSRESAYASGKIEQGKTIKKMIEALDNGMAGGIGKAHDAETSALWRDLNERYAMIRLVQNHGMDATVGVDAKKLNSWLMANDARRVLERRGGRVQGLHDIATYSKIVSDSTISALPESSQKFKLPHLMTTPNAAKASRADQFWFNRYKNGWPNSTGLLKLRNEGPLTAGNFTRALSQGNDLPNKVLSAAEFIESKVMDREAASSKRDYQFDGGIIAEEIERIRNQQRQVK